MRADHEESRESGEMTYEEIGALLGMSKTTVQMIARRALAKLARAMGDPEPWRRLPGWIKAGGRAGLGRQSRCSRCGKAGHNVRSCGREPLRR